MTPDHRYFKRKKRKASDFRREENKRQPYDRILIVCEGSKTEPNYFKGLRDELKLSTVNIEICGCSSGLDPMSIVNFALERHEGYDRIYCVFDKEYSNYQEALDKIKIEHQRGIPIYAIPSVLCFEYWFLLHFIESTKPYLQKGKKSAADQLVSELKCHLKDYSKGDKLVFAKIKHLLQEAIVRAKRVYKSQQENGTDNPSTKVHELVEYLRNIRKLWEITDI